MLLFHHSTLFHLYFLHCVRNAKKMLDMMLGYIYLSIALDNQKVNYVMEKMKIM